MSVVRLLVLSACVAAGWLALSLALSTPGASAATAPAGWGSSSDGDDKTTGLSGILGSVTSVVDTVVSSPVVDTATDLLTQATAPVDKALDGSALQGAAGTVSSALTTTADLVDTAVTELDQKVVDPVVTSLDNEVIDPALTGLNDRVIGPTLTELDNRVIGPIGAVIDDTIVGPLPPLPANPVTTDEVLDPVAESLTATPPTTTSGEPWSNPDPTDSLAAQVAHLTAALWPLSDSSPPWSPRELILVSAGVLTAASPGGPGGAGPSACDIPLTDQWFGIRGGAISGAADDRVPLSPAYDTDCTPD